MSDGNRKRAQVADTERDQSKPMHPVAPESSEVTLTDTTYSADDTNQPELSTQVRQAVGQQMEFVTSTINNNLIAARYATASSILLLTAYGLFNTPLFFRYRKVSEIPASYFKRRKSLYGRVVGVNIAGQSIHLTVRHLSPVGMLLPKSWLDTLMKYNPAAPSTKGNSIYKVTPAKELQIEIAGILPPPLLSEHDRISRSLDVLNRNSSFVKCQLLSRRVPCSESTNNDDNFSMTKTQHGTASKQLLAENTVEGQIAICRVYFRQPTRFWQLFADDLAQSLTQSGVATVSSSLLPPSGEDFKTLDGAQDLKLMRQDIQYMETLAQAEFEAAKKSAGMWSVKEIRETRRDVVEEAEFQTNASIFQRIWRWIRS